MDKDIRKEKEELAEYQKKSFITRAVVAAGTIILSGVAGYLGSKLSKK